MQCDINLICHHQGTISDVKLCKIIYCKYPVCQLSCHHQAMLVIYMTARKAEKDCLHEVKFTHMNYINDVQPQTHPPKSNLRIFTAQIMNEFYFMCFNNDIIFAFLPLKLWPIDFHCNRVRIIFSDN